jgi:glycosyltransferase involved in cell wall biosynthesis
VLDDRRLRVVVLAPNPRNPGGVTQVVEGWLQAGLEHDVDLDVIEVAAWDSPVYVQVAQTARAYVRLIRRLVDPGRRPAAVHLNVSTGPSLYREFIAQLIVRAFGVPTVVQLHSGGFEHWIYQSLVRLWVSYTMFTKAAVAIVVAHRWKPLASGLGARRVFVVPPLLPPALERALTELGAERKGPRKRANGELRLLFYGRWAPIKGVDILAKAVGSIDPERQRRITLKIFGNGDEEWLDSCLCSIGHAKVEVGGWLDDVGKLEELRNADAFILASRREAFPQSVLEVVAAQVPIIASDTGGVAETVGDYPLALLVTREDVGSLRDAIERLLDGEWPAEHPQHLIEGIPQHHSASVILRELQLAYEAACRNGGKPERVAA